jgi:hypothetical protein
MGLRSPQPGCESRPKVATMLVWGRTHSSVQRAKRASFHRTQPRVSPSPAVTKIAIDKRPPASENREHEESWTSVLPAFSRLRGEEAAGCAHPAAHSEPVAATHRGTHRTLRSSQAGKCQHSNLHLCARHHRDRFENRAHDTSVQGNERRKINPGPPRRRPM